MPQAGVCVSLCACVCVYLACPFDRQSLDVSVICLSPRQCKGSLGLLGYWPVVISREAPQCSLYTTALVKASWNSLRMLLNKSISLIQYEWKAHVFVGWKLYKVPVLKLRCDALLFLISNTRSLLSELNVASSLLSVVKYASWVDSLELASYYAWALCFFHLPAESWKLETLLHANLSKKELGR